jgi:hypothetical protein
MENAIEHDEGTSVRALKKPRTKSTSVPEFETITDAEIKAFIEQFENELAKTITEDFVRVQSSRSMKELIDSGVFAFEIKTRKFVPI